LYSLIRQYYAAGFAIVSALPAFTGKILYNKLRKVKLQRPYDLQNEVDESNKYYCISILTYRMFF